MVSVGVSKLGYTNSIFVDPVVKVNGSYYRDVLLSQQLLPAIRQVYGIGVLNRSARHHPQRTGLARRSTSFSARFLHSSRQICGRLTTPITVRLTTKSEASASLDKSAPDVDDLRQRLIDVLTGIQQSVICNAIEWHRRLHTCIQAIGGHFEYSL